MNDTHSPNDRLEARLDYQAARIDELYRLLEEHELLAPPATDSDDLFDELVDVEDSPLALSAVDGTGLRATPGR